MAKKKNSKNNTTAIDSNTYRFWYENMLLQRKFEEKSAQLYIQQKIRGFCHLYIGQEAVSAGTVSALKDSDNIITAYRDHGLALAKGVSADSLMAELFGKITGCSKGKGGSMHMFSKEKRFFGGHGIVGGQVPLGAGIAFAEKYQKTKNVTVCFMGDGAVHQGAVSEALNMASLWSLPVIFVCENNGYAMGTSVERSTHQKDIYKIGESYSISSRWVDGMHPKTVHEAMAEAAENARKKQGPSFLEIRTYRYRGHSMSDPAKYRTKEELEKYKAQDPIETVKEELIKQKMADQKWIDETTERVAKTVHDCVQFAEDSPFPENAELYKDCYKQEDYPFIMA